MKIASGELTVLYSEVKSPVVFAQCLVALEGAAGRKPWLGGGVTKKEGSGLSFSNNTNTVLLVTQQRALEPLGRTLGLLAPLLQPEEMV